MSLYRLTPKPGFERYSIDVGWSPHRALFANVDDHSWNPDTDPENEPESVNLGLIDDIHDPAEVLTAVHRYAVVPDDLIHDLRSDMHSHPVRRRPLPLA